MLFYRLTLKSKQTVKSLLDNPRFFAIRQYFCSTSSSTALFQLGLPPSACGYAGKVLLPLPLVQAPCSVFAIMMWNLNCSIWLQILHVRNNDLDFFNKIVHNRQRLFFENDLKVFSKPFVERNVSPAVFVKNSYLQIHKKSSLNLYCALKLTFSNLIFAIAPISLLARLNAKCSEPEILLLLNTESAMLFFLICASSVDQCRTTLRVRL